jgi:prophage regulatory protein
MVETLITLEGLRERGIPTSNSRLRRLESAGLFPKRIRPTPRTFAWLADELESHIAKVAAARSGGVA